MSDHRATKKLIEYLKIKSVHPDPDYGKDKSLKTNLLIVSLKYMGKKKRVLWNSFENMPKKSDSIPTKRSK